jgi:hypothetical protein
LRAFDKGYDYGTELLVKNGNGYATYAETLESV